MRNADLAIDLGTAGARIAARGRGVVATEPSVVALRVGPRGREVEAIGTAAEEMLGRAPAGIEVGRPVRGGVVADFESTEHLVRHMVRASGSRSLMRPRIVLPIPGVVTEVERRAILDSTRSAGAREAAVVPAPLAAALGAGLAIDEPTGRCVIDIGAGVTQIAVVSLGGIVVQECVRLGGEDLDEATALWLRSRRGIIISIAQARPVREQAGIGKAPVVVRGRDVQTGKPRETPFTISDLLEAVTDPLVRVRDAVLAVLAATPPELAADIHDSGIVLCGGCAKSRPIGHMLRKATRLALARAADPETAVIRGAALLLENPDLLERISAGK